MKVYIKLLIQQEHDRSTASIYLSIAMAYLYRYNWDEAAYILTCIKNLALLPEEERAWFYLWNIIKAKDTSKLKDLFSYLNDE